MKPFYGWIIVGAGIVVTCVGFGAMFSLGVFLQPMSALALFQVYFSIVVGFAAGSLYAPMTATATRWFTRHRSLAVALVSAGLGLGSTTTAPLARWLITNSDWRLAMMVIGGLAWLFIIPAALLVREPPAPETRGLAGAPAGDDDRQFTAAQALRTPQFAAIAFTYFACCAAHSGPIFHMVTLALDHGVPAMVAATVLSAAGLASLSGKVNYGSGQRFRRW